MALGRQLADDKPRHRDQGRRDQGDQKLALPDDLKKPSHRHGMILA